MFFHCLFPVSDELEPVLGLLSRGEKATKATELTAHNTLVYEKRGMETSCSSQLH